MIKIRDLSKSYGGHRVLDQLSIEFDSFGITVIVGLNGAGKTVFLNTLSGITSYDQGQIEIDGYSLEDSSCKRYLFYIPSDSYLPEYMSGREYANFVQHRYDVKNKDIFEEVSKLLDMTTALDKPIESYSFGMKKKLQIALSLSLDIRYLIADEVFSGLDLETVILTQELFSLFSKKHKIILVSHERNIINQFSKNILLMKKGKLSKFEGTVDELSKYIYQQGHISEKLQRITELI